MVSQSGTPHPIPPHHHCWKLGLIANTNHYTMPLIHCCNQVRCQFPLHNPQYKTRSFPQLDNKPNWGIVRGTMTPTEATHAHDTEYYMRCQWATDRFTVMDVNTMQSSCQLSDLCHISSSLTVSSTDLSLVKWISLYSATWHVIRWHE